MTSLQDSSIRSPQLQQIPRGSPAGSITKSPSQFSAVSLLASPSPNRKRVHPDYLKIDDAAPPNKKLNTPTKEEKETIQKEKEMLYKRLEEEKRAPFYLTPFPILPLGHKFGSLSPSVYSFFQQQQQQQQQAATTQQAFPSNLTLSPSAPLVSNLSTSGATSFALNSPGSNSSLVGNTAGISGLPTPGGSSVGTPPRTLYPSQLYPTPLLRFPFSPPTPSSLGLPSPWNYSSNRSASVSSSVATPGPPSTESDTAAGASGAGSGSSDALATSTPKGDSETAGQKEAQPHSPATSSSSSTDKAGLTPGVWLVNASNSTPAIQTKTHLKHPYASIQSPLGHSQMPYSPAMQGMSYPGSVSSCPSVSSSSGCSSASENQDTAVSKGYILSEYHVGPHRLISEKELDNQSEEATTSGRNTPVDPVAEDNRNCVLPGDMAEKLLSNASRCYTVPNRTGLTPEPGSGSHHPRRFHGSKKSRATKSNSPHPFSVESLNSPQGYLTGCHGMDRPSSGVSSMSSSLSSRDSTPDPDPDELKQDPNKTPQGTDAFCLVPGRLSLLSSTQKYKVTVDEVRRRLSHPECLNASVLGGILRRAKSKNGGTVLRQRLQEIGVLLPSGRRKQTELSLLTSLVENEALHLAGDFHRLCDNFFPHAELGQIIARQHVGTPEAQHRVSMVKATQVIVSELQAMLDAVGGPSNIRPNDPANPYPGLTNFSLITHSFGTPALNTGLGVLQTYLQELLAYYEGKKPIQPPENRYGGVLGENSNSPQTPSHAGSVDAMHGTPHPQQHPHHPHHPHGSHHPLQNPLLHATRHYSSTDGQEAVSSTDTERISVEVATFKEEPVASPNFT